MAALSWPTGRDVAGGAGGRPMRIDNQRWFEDRCCGLRSPRVGVSLAPRGIDTVPRHDPQLAFGQAEDLR